MSKRNSRFQKAVRREQRAEDAQRATFIHEVSREDYPFMTREERRKWKKKNKK